MQDKELKEKLDEVIDKQKRIIKLFQDKSGKEPVKLTPEEMTKFYDYKLKAKNAKSVAEVKMFANVMENILDRAKVRNKARESKEKEKLLLSLIENQQELAKLLKNLDT